MLKKLIKFYKAIKFKNKIIPNYQIKKSNSQNNQIIYILPSNVNHKAGGDKVIYNHAEKIESLSLNGFNSEVLHIYNLDLSLNWFKHNVKTKNNLFFDPILDFVMIPEMLIVPHAALLRNKGIKYGIFVQNVYSIEIPMYFASSREEIDSAYKYASVVLSISEDTTNGLLFNFPYIENKIYRVFNFVNDKLFTNSLNKENIITYMPRKLKRHSDLVLFYIIQKLPINWKIISIDGLNEIEVANLLSKSKIFLSFSELEGLGLPPIEAALAGNYVIGYTGQAGKEYWDKRIFTEIENGDILSFSSAVLNLINIYDELNKDDFESGRVTLKQMFSNEAETDSLFEVTSAIKQKLL
jgi:hypothetical protein